DIVDREAGEPRELLRGRLALGRGRAIAFRQRRQVLAERELPRGVDRLLQIAGEIGRQLLVIPRGRRVGLEVRRVGDVVLRREQQVLERERRRNQRDAVQLDAVPVLQLLREPRRSNRAVALADQVFRRREAV